MILSICPNPSIDKFISLHSFKPEEVNRSTGETPFPGGKGVHVALAVRELGNESHLVGFWGGATGQWIRDECELLGVRCYGPEIRDWTRTCLTINTENESKDTEILEQGPEINKKVLSSLWSILRNQIQVAEAVCISGSWPRGAPNDVYLELKKICESAEKPMWVDASGLRLKQAVEVKPYGIHINKAEARSLMGSVEHPSEYAKNLLKYCKISAVSDGANGLFLAMDDKIFHARYPVKNVISTVGSGDCLLAGLLVSQQAGGDLENMARTATACGAANCIRPELGRLHRKDVNHIKDRVTCELVT